MRGLLVCGLVAFGAAGFAQDRLPTVDPEDAIGWESLQGALLSPDGRWFAAQIGRSELDPEVFLRETDGEVVTRVSAASGIRFSDDSEWFGYTKLVPQKERETLRERNRRIENGLVVHKLGTEEKLEYDAVASWEFLEGGRFLAVRHLRAESVREGGSDLRIVELETGVDTVLGNVASFSARPESDTLALILHSPAGERGLQLFEPSERRITTLVTGEREIRRLAWAEETDALAFLYAKSDDAKVGDHHTIELFTDLDGDREHVSYDSSEIEGVPEGHRIVDFAGLMVSPTAHSILFATQPWESVDRNAPDSDELPSVQIWHYEDVDPIPLQRVQNSRFANRADRWIWRVEEDTTLHLAEPHHQGFTWSDDHSVFGYSDLEPYATPVKVGGITSYDQYAVTVPGLERHLIVEGANNGTRTSLSNTGRFMAYWDEGDWWLYDVETEDRTNLTHDLEMTFASTTYDGPLPMPIAGGSPTWTLDDETLLLRGAYDLLEVDLETMERTRLTFGEEDDLRFLPLNVGLNEDGYDADDPLYVSMSDVMTKATGVGRIGEDGLEPLLMDDATLWFLSKSKDTDRTLVRYETFSQPTQVLVGNLELNALKPLLTLNPQQEEFAWGETKLLQYRAADKDLQAVLVYPADYDPDRRYPMITYIYERMSQSLHRYDAPTRGDAYDAQLFSQAGYFVLMPDIAYRENSPGPSTIECLDAALDAALEAEPNINRRRIGLTGHSWGGYGTVFAATRSDRFHAFVAGAPLTEMNSMYDSFYFNSGQTNQVIFESSQGRLNAPWWEIPEAYDASNPILEAQNVAGPMMVAFGDRDGAVDWSQGQQLFNVMRRMGKSIVMLVYEGENHGNARSINRLDYATRARHFFDVHLKGRAAESWLEDGVSWLELRDERERIVELDEEHREAAEASDSP